MEERKNDTNVGAHNNVSGVFDKLSEAGRRILRNFKYEISIERSCKKWWRVQLLLCFVLPLSALGLSMYFLWVDKQLYFIVIAGSVAYKALVTICEYHNYKQAGTGQRATGIRPENPFFIKFGVIIFALLIIGVAITSHLFEPRSVPFESVVLLCGFLDICITCGLDVLGALVVLYDAQAPSID